MLIVAKTLGIVLALGTYAVAAQLVNSEACDAVATTFGPLGSTLAKVLLVCL